jgi:hypothetical protein
MQVGLNSTLYIKVLMMCNPVTLVKADADDHEFACVQVKKHLLMGRGDIIKNIFRDIQY